MAGVRRVIITGATGFIGRRIVELASSTDWEVFCCGRSIRPDWLHDGVQWLQGNLLDETFRSELILAVKPTHLINLAWYTEHSKYWSGEENVSWLFSTLDLFEKFAKIGGVHFLGAGSCAEYDWSSSVYSEKVTPLTQAHIFGVSKASASTLIQQLSSLNLCKSSWGRIFFVYGPNEAKGRLVPHVVTKLLSKQSVDVSEGTQVRDYLFVDDVARAFIEISKKELEGPINIGSGVPTSIRDLVSQIEKIVGATNQVNFGALPDRENDPFAIVADVRRMRTELNYRPQFTLAEGLRKTVEHYKSSVL